MEFVDLVKSFPTLIWSQKAASIQPRTNSKMRFFVKNALPSQTIHNFYRTTLDLYVFSCQLLYYLLSSCTCRKRCLGPLHHSVKSSKASPSYYWCNFPSLSPSFYSPVAMCSDPTSNRNYGNLSKSTSRRSSPLSLKSS